MPGPVFLDGDTVSLRPATDADVSFLRENEQDPQIRASRSVQTPVSEEQARRRIGGTMGRSDDTLGLLVCRDTTPVGFVYLLREQPNADVYRAAELAYWVTPGEWGNGYATAASELAVEYAFAELGLHRVDASAFESNTASKRVLEKLGFTREGTARRAAYVDGEWIDVAEFGLLESEWATGRHEQS
ncbi:GNAT family N-acetyltransferase [Halobacterium jilantaiense]|uniref:Protein N-acetyltransferase, RimJ/RimL family n=1 Tax=Halobacterium jilantaiense TaxID=355548 RepID=A0A1I0QP16_9EURY|nr:GNAT family protein [Halobacterium jilantaiense]SEW28993.1 Protein N-acetyltransferase, RimJ/RimL family [Halobacterium jilantaiense]